MLWDSSIHDSVFLNRVTQSHERVYLILKVSSLKTCRTTSARKFRRKHGAWVTRWSCNVACFEAFGRKTFSLALVMWLQRSQWGHELLAKISVVGQYFCLVYVVVVSYLRCQWLIFSLFLQVIVRLASPISMDLVLRKRISVKVYKRQSWKDSLLKKITRVSTFTLFATPEILRGMGTSFQRKDFWVRLGGQALVMIGRWYSRPALTNHK